MSNRDAMEQRTRRARGPSIETLQVCRSGHLIRTWTELNPRTNQSHCSKCGAPTLTCCPSCNEDIREDITDIAGVELPQFCKYCGEAFPWAGMRSEQGHGQPDPAARVTFVLARFERMAMRLKSRDRKPPIAIADEYDVQYILEALLAIDFDDVRREEPTPSLVAGFARADFLLKKERILIEVKKTRGDLGPKELKKQLLEDIPHYRRHSDCRTLVCFIYDPEEHIKNQAAMKSDLEGESRDETRVIVVIAPAR